MLQNILLTCFKSRNQRFLHKLSPTIKSIKAHYHIYCQLTDTEIKNLTADFKLRINNGETLDSLLPEAFAAVMAASNRTLKICHYDEQLIGGIVLHMGKISEMGTGEGKTLAATLPAYLNALTGKGVHIVTVNPYLAERDSSWMAPVYNALDLTVSVVTPDLETSDRAKAYLADITYGTNSEFGFDYLRDNMAIDKEHQVQRGLNFTIIDEVDSILIDEARTPLIISGESDDSIDKYPILNGLAKKLSPNTDFNIDEKSRSINLTETGHTKIEEELAKSNILQDGGLYDVHNINILHTLNSLLKAHNIFKKDVHYIVKNQQIVIIDENTGRAMANRRWSDGIHQAIEIKEGVSIQKENKTLASITLQNYFRMYNKLSGMTGTADTESYEFQQIYNLEVIVIPTHKPIARVDMSDKMYISLASKYKAIVKDIQERHATGQPILVGTSSIDSSEHLSKMLTHAKIKHNVLNAKNHAREAEIIASAGTLNAVTIATNMAGRGTDIVLGGIDNSQQKQVLNLGGLHVLGTERHESRRIDNQLRGRSGRQGDTGSSQFYLSLDDSLMRIFASPKIREMIRKLGLNENETIEHSMLTRQIESAQRKVEGYNFDIRKQLIQFDDVANEQRHLIYKQRQTLLETNDIKENINNILQLIVNTIIDEHLPENSFAENWNIDDLMVVLRQDFNILCPIDTWISNENEININTIKQRIIDKFQQTYAEKNAHVGDEIMRQIEINIMLQNLDQFWQMHLSNMDSLREGIHLRGYAQKNPIEEYKKDSFDLFKEMLFNIKRTTLSQIFQAEIVEENPTADISRNQLCPCNSGKKYKHCHGKVA